MLALHFAATTPRASKIISPTIYVQCHVDEQRHVHVHLPTRNAATHYTYKTTDSFHVPRSANPRTWKMPSAWERGFTVWTRWSNATHLVHGRLVMTSLWWCRVLDLFPVRESNHESSKRPGKGFTAWTLRERLKRHVRIVAMEFYPNGKPYTPVWTNSRAGTGKVSRRERSGNDSGGHASIVTMALFPHGNLYTPVWMRPNRGLWDESATTTTGAERSKYECGGLRQSTKDMGESEGGRCRHQIPCNNVSSATAGIRPCLLTQMRLSPVVSGYITSHTTNVSVT